MFDAEIAIVEENTPPALVLEPTSSMNRYKQLEGGMKLNGTAI